MGFSLGQPYLIHATITYITYHARLPENYGYGLIGAYALCYIGLAVSSPDTQILISRIGHSNVPAFPTLVDANRVSGYDENPRSSGHFHLQENANC